MSSTKARIQRSLSAESLRPLSTFARATSSPHRYKHPQQELRKHTVSNPLSEKSANVPKASFDFRVPAIAHPSASFTNTPAESVTPSTEFQIAYQRPQIQLQMSNHKAMFVFADLSGASELSQITRHIPVIPKATDDQPDLTSIFDQGSFNSNMDVDEEIAGIDAILNPTQGDIVRKQIADEPFLTGAPMLPASLTRFSRLSATNSAMQRHKLSLADTEPADSEKTENKTDNQPLPLENTPSMHDSRARPDNVFKALTDDLPQTELRSPVRVAPNPESSANRLAALDELSLATAAMNLLPTTQSSPLKPLLYYKSSRKAIRKRPRPANDSVSDSEDDFAVLLRNNVDLASDDNAFRNKTKRRVVSNSILLYL